MRDGVKEVAPGRFREVQGRYFEEFEVGHVYEHRPGRTITDADNVWFTLLTMNTHPAHFDYEFSKKTEFGKPLVVSPFTIALMTGMSVSDTSGKAIANLGWDEVRMTHPLFVGDTLYAESEVLEKRESKSRPDQGIVTFKTIGKKPGRHRRQQLQAHRAGVEARARPGGRLRRVYVATALAPKYSGDTARPAMDPDEEAAFLDAIDKWVQKEVRPVVMKHDHGDIWPAELVAQMADMGLFGATIGEEYGGLGLPAVTYAKIVAHIASYWMAITGIFNSHLIMACAVERFGTPAQKAHWLPKFATGEIRGGLALTEPNAGTDLQAIRTVAVRDGDDYVINGTKTWISNGIQGSCFALLVKTDPKADPRYKGMSLMIAPKGPGFTVGKKFEKLGYHAIDSAELIFEDYRIPADNLIGGVEGQGFFQATGGLELGRINVAARGVGLAEGSLRLATEYAQLRQTMGKPIAEHQAIQLYLGEMVTRARAAAAPHLRRRRSL